MLDPGPLGGNKPLLGLDARAERMALADPASRYIGPVFASRNELCLASISTFAVVAGQTQVHSVTVATLRPAIMPPTAKVSAVRDADVTNSRGNAISLPDHQRCDRPRLND